MSRILKPCLAGGLAAVLLSTSPILAQRGEKSRRQFAETVEVVTIEVPVQVISDGEPLRGLTAENFEVYDGRKRQTLTGFDVVDLQEEGSGSLPIQQIPISARRHFLLLFDLTFADPAVVARARHAALELARKDFHPSDVVAVATYSHQQGPQLILGFTSDRRQVEIAIETLGLPSLVERASDPLALVLGEGYSGLETSGQGETVETAGPGLVAESELFESLADYSVGFDRSARGEAQGQVTALTTAFQDLAKALQDVQGRKHVVYLSEGFDASLILGTDDASRRQEVASSSATGQYWLVDSEEMYGSTGAMTALGNMLEEFRRADCTIQSVDIGGLRAGQQASARSRGQESLFMMANQTGGELYRNFNDLGAAMDEMLTRTSVTYLLAFQPAGLDFDGDFHKLRIELKGAPRGARVLHRPGYYAPRPYGERSPIEKRLQAAEKILSGRDSGVFTTSVFSAPFRAEAGRAYVPVLIEIDGPGLLAGLSGQTAALEIYAYAIAEDGTVADFLTQNMGLDMEKVRPALEASGLKFFGDLDLPAGEYLLRVLVRDSENGRSSARAVSLTVPEFGSGPPTLAMPLFPEQPGKWLMVQEASGSAARTERPYPFLLDGNAYMPAAKPVVQTNGSARFVVLGYNLGDDAVPLETQFITADGAPVEGPTISFVSRDEGASPDATQLVLQLEANGLAPGEYRLVTGLEGQERTTSIPFVVEGG